MTPGTGEAGAATPAHANIYTTQRRSTVTISQTPAAPPDLPPDILHVLGVDPVGSWARRKIREAQPTGTFPRYGSAGWIRLEDSDPRKIAAVLAAAECWRLESNPAWRAALIQAEQDGARAAYLRDVDRNWGEVQATWSELSRHIGRIEQARRAGGDIGLPLAERRRLAAIPRPGDHPGGPVTWEPAPAAEQGAA
ncbi:hypothetical protein FDG2_1695 [Candidatus Protofrankia californiensis]|uniref:Uncharacterized protein n=1 Tax=Candidatus Protofrankia californiensis TaxID=1839754 RepID=A0A1C3NW47_9ACTN|nr:hypothetical protein FDG2_1695 [Candidatus Protofrankia californiensis]